MFLDNVKESLIKLNLFILSIYSPRNSRMHNSVLIIISFMREER